LFELEGSHHMACMAMAGKSSVEGSLSFSCPASGFGYQCK